MFLFKMLNLDDKQKAKLQAWLESLPEDALRGCSETCTSEGPEFAFKGFDTGIGPVYWVELKSGRVIFRCHLAYDDDGELL